MTEHETEIRAHIAKIPDALRAKDLEALRRLYSADVVSFDIEPPLQHVGIEAKLTNWKRVFAFFDTVDYEVRDLEIMEGGDLAVGHAFGRLSGTLPNGTPVAGMWVRATFVLNRAGGEWLIVHDQVSVPFDIATGKGVIDLEP